MTGSQHVTQHLEVAGWVSFTPAKTPLDSSRSRGVTLHLAMPAGDLILLAILGAHSATRYHSLAPMVDGNQKLEVHTHTVGWRRLGSACPEHRSARVTGQPCPASTQARGLPPFRPRHACIGGIAACAWRAAARAEAACLCVRTTTATAAMGRRKKYRPALRQAIMSGA
jgi:hypothetical protein